MINNINRQLNNLRINTNEYNKIKNTLNKQGNIMDKSIYNQLNNLDKSQKKIVEDFLLKISNQIKDAEMIAIKIVKNDNITKDELEFITKLYPDIKKNAQNAKHECDELKLKLKNDENNRSNIVKKLKEDLESILKNGKVFEVEKNIKKVVIKEIELFSQRLDEEYENLEDIFSKAIKEENIVYEEKIFIAKRYPKLNEILKEFIYIIDELEEELIKYDNDDKKKEIILNFIKETKEINIEKDIINYEKKYYKDEEKYISDNRISYKEQIKLLNKYKLEFIEKLEEKLRNDKDINYLNPYIYIQKSFEKPSRIVILFIVVIIIYSLFW